MRKLTYAQAIREAHAQMLAYVSRVFVVGQGLWSPWYAGSSLQGLDREFGRERIVDSPVSENAVTGMAVGAALAGFRAPVVSLRVVSIVLGTGAVVKSAVESVGLFSG